MSHRRHRLRGSGSLLVAVAIGAAGGAPTVISAPADPVVATGSLDYDALTTAQIDESVITNTVELTFDAAGGPFTAVASLTIAHDVRDRGCRFVSDHRWEASGEFRPGTRQFVGEYREVTETTQGACENFTFTRTFDPDVGRFVADLDPVTGTIISRIDPVDFEASVDPALVASLVPSAPPVGAETVLTRILDEIAARHEPVTATGEATAPTGDGVTVPTNSFRVEFNPLGGDVAVSGEQAVQSELVLGDGRVCTMLTTATVDGGGRFDPVEGTITGTAVTDVASEVVDCDIPVEPSPGRSGTIDLSVDPAAGVVSGAVGGFGIAATFDPATLPPAPDEQFQIGGLAYGLGPDVLTIAIDWKDPWPPRMVDALLVGGEILTEDGPISFGLRFDAGVSSTFMEPDGDYRAYVDDRGRTILEIGVPDAGVVGGPIIRMRTWYAEREDDPGTSIAVFADVIDPVASPLDGTPVERVSLPFGLPAVWAGDAATAVTTPEPDDGADDGADAGATPDAPADVGEVEPDDDAADAPAAASPEDDGGGFPWPVLLIPLAGLGALAGALLLRRRSPVVPSAGCDELERAWRDAQRRCDDATARADALSRESDAHEERRRTAQRALDGLPSEETRVELPDGTTISELDLHLRRRAAGAAWDAYVADPSPESARAAEDAWNEQATPEWREEQRRLAREARDRLEGERDGAQADRERAGEELADARRSQRDACGAAAEARRRLDECLAAAAAAPPAERPAAGAPAPVPEPAAGNAPPPEPPSEPEPEPPEPEPVPAPPSGGTTGGGGAAGDGPCREGAERWVEFDGPHYYELAVDRVVEIGIQLIAGTRRFDHLGSLDASGVVVLDDRGRAESIPLDTFAALTPAEIEQAFGGLTEIWEAAGSGAEQRIAITLSVRVRTATVVCDRKERCEGGEWVDTGERRSRISGDVATESRRSTIVGNVQPGVGRTAGAYNAEIVALFRQLQGRARRLLDFDETYRQYQRDCRGGRRG